MHILLTDILTCPRCGPEFGLIVLADRVIDRRVLEGYLGCPNCRNEYPIRAGVADLRIESHSERAMPPLADDPERAYRLAALVGVADQPGSVLVIGAHPAMVARVAGLLPGATVIGASTHPPPAGGAEGVSWIVHDSFLPLRDRSLRGAAAVGGAHHLPLEQAARTLLPGARIVIDPASEITDEVLASHGFTLLLDQEGVAVASRNPPR